MKSGSIEYDILGSRAKTDEIRITMKKAISRAFMPLRVEKRRPVINAAARVIKIDILVKGMTSIAGYKV